MSKQKTCPCARLEDPRARELTAWIAEHRDEPGVALPALQRAHQILHTSYVVRSYEY